MQVILLDKVVNLGALGDEVKVRPGYGRNYLIPNGKAVMATPDNKAHFEERRAELEKASADALTAAQARADQLEGFSVEMSSKAGDGGKLFGSIGTADIAAAITEKGVELAKNEIRMPEGALRNTGEYEVAIQLHTDVATAVKVVIVAE